MDNLVDFHSHMLPGIDDGSKSIEESLDMLWEFANQGVDLVAATPHFYAQYQSPGEFLRRRQEAWERLRSHMEADMPKVLLGAEVRYFEGICTFDELRSLQLQKTQVLLLEMPFIRWSSRMVDDILELNSRPGVIVLLAHIERYLAYQPESTWDLLRSARVRMQSNASFFLERKTRRRALKMLEAGEIHVICSDAHNMKARPPNLGKAMELIQAKLGKTALEQLERQVYTLLMGEETIIY